MAPTRSELPLLSPKEEQRGVHESPLGTHIVPLASGACQCHVGGTAGNSADSCMRTQLATQAAA
jgi:hypothetical protein